MGKKADARINYLDTAKGIGIILVCIGHACTNQAVAADAVNADIIRFVTLFHMALFFFINGMLYNEKYSERPVHGIVKKVKAYYIPFVTYNLIFWLFHNLFAKLHLISGELDAKDYAYTGLKSFLTSFLKSVVGFRQRFAGAMWFLECLVLISVLFIILDYIAKKWFPKRKMLFLSSGVVLIVLINRLFNLIDIPYIPGSISQMVYWGLNGLVFFYLGYLYQHQQWNRKLSPKKGRIAAALFAVLVITVILMKPDIVSVITNASIPVYRNGLKAITGGENTVGLSLLKYLGFAVVCLAGIIMTLLLSQCRGISDNKLLKLCGRYSLHIMCLQFLAFKAVSAVIVIGYDLPLERLAEYPVLHDVNGIWWIVYAAAGCILPILTIALLNQVKKLVWKRKEIRN